MFSQAEALALVMAVLDGHHDAAGDSPVGHALRILLRALPEPVAAQADAVRRTATPAPDRSAARPDPATTVALVQACADRRRGRLGYPTPPAAEAGGAREPEGEPGAVVIRHGRWYLLCRSVAADAVRTYRVDRVTSVATVPGAVERPDDLDPVGVLEEHLAQGWAYPTEVVLHASLAEITVRMPAALGRLTAEGPTTTRLVGATNNPIWYAEMLAAVGVAFTILGGPALAAAAREIGERLIAATTPPP